MSRQDEWVSILTVIFILIYFSVWMIGLASNRLPFLAAALNAAFGLSVIIYWIQKQCGIQQHIVETREIIFLVLEVLVIGLAAYSIINRYLDGWAKGLQYLAFAVHLLCLIFFFLFILMFKMNRLI